MSNFAVRGASNSSQPFEFIVDPPGFDEHKRYDVAGTLYLQETTNFAYDSQTDVCVSAIFRRLDGQGNLLYEWAFAYDPTTQTEIIDATSFDPLTFKPLTRTHSEKEWKSGDSRFTFEELDSLTGEPSKIEKSWWENYVLKYAQEIFFVYDEGTMHMRKSRTISSFGDTNILHIEVPIIDPATGQETGIDVTVTDKYGKVVPQDRPSTTLQDTPVEP